MNVKLKKKSTTEEVKIDKFYSFDRKFITQNNFIINTFSQCDLIIQYAAMNNISVTQLF